jgi:hypothetical protein
MARRLLTLIVAVVVSALPVAAQVCETTCTQHAGHSENHASHHHHPASASGQSHHHDHSASIPQSASGTPTVGSLLRACGLVAAVVSESRETMRSSVATIAIRTPRVAAPIDQATEVRDFDSRHGAPAAIRSIAPLRI